MITHPSPNELSLNPLEQSHFPTRVRSCALSLARRGVVALGDLFDAVAPRAVRFAMTITRNQDDAEDALQAAMVRVALHPMALAEAWHPWAYLLKIVRNEALKILRKKRPDQVLALVGDVCADMVVEDSESRQLVRAALQKLPPTQSEVVVLKIWEGMTFAEIGEVLGESPNTAASRYRYALQKLTHFLQPLADEVPT
jgi:RNA polymerase sigma-70 factor, ECF subfamily